MSGPVGDVLNGVVDMSFDIYHTFHRHGVVEWSSSFLQSRVIFVVHRGRNYFPKSVVLYTFTMETWLLFLVTVMITAIVLKGVKDVIPLTFPNKMLDFHKIMDYFLATLLEHGCNLSEKCFSSSVKLPIRILLSFWLLFILVFTTANKAKLTTFLGFPFKTFVPETFKQLAESDFQIGINAISKD